jgi:hypothetical protein
MFRALRRWLTGQPLATGTTLQVAPSSYRTYVSLLLAYIERVKAEQKEGVVTVLLAEFVPTTWCGEALHNSWIFRLKVALLYQPWLLAYRSCCMTRTRAVGAGSGCLLRIQFRFLGKQVS